jgi:hypothetical protein
LGAHSSASLRADWAFRWEDLTRDAIDAGWALKMGDMADVHGEKLLTYWCLISSEWGDDPILFTIFIIIGFPKKPYV